MTKTQILQSVTFEQLSEALTQLGFEMRETLEFTMFRNAEFDAVIILPREDASSILRPIHLAAARATVAGKGVAAPVDFDRLLIQARQIATRQEGSRVAGDPGRAVPSQTADASLPKRKAKKKARLQAA